MRNIQRMVGVVLAGIVCVGGAWAEEVKPEVVVLSDADGRALLRKSNCLACHAIDKKVVGPSFNDVAAKYRGQADAQAKLISKVTKGGAGVWGKMPMPPQRAKQEDIKLMVDFVLSLK